MTFSINTGTSTQASVVNIIGATAIDFSELLYKLKDNEDKEINPIDLRDSVLTSYSTQVFKETHASQSSLYYIGIDNGNTDYSNKDIKNKIYLGKRSCLTNDIMTDSLLNSDADIILFNTKRDTISNYRTRLSILSGTNSNIYTEAPYIQSQVITLGTYSSLSLDLINNTNYGGTLSMINLYSSSGTISVNDIIFPTVASSSSSADNDRVLQCMNGELIWADLTYSVSNYAGTTGIQLDFYGSQVNVNDYPIDFTSNEPCPINLGDIKMGETFNSVSIFEMLQRIIYPYLPPICQLSISPPYNSGCAEVGTSPTIKLVYTIVKRSLPTLTSVLSYMIPSNYPPITTSGLVTVSGSASGVIITPVTSAISSFSISVSDGTQSCVATASILGVYPYFTGFSALSTMTTAGLLSMTKLVESFGDKYIDVYGSGNLYFIYDSDYPVLSDILDELGNSIFSNFTSSLVILSSPTGLWTSKEFIIYQLDGVSQVGPPSVNYYFKY